MTRDTNNSKKGDKEKKEKKPSALDKARATKAGERTPAQRLMILKANQKALEKKGHAEVARAAEDIVLERLRSRVKKGLKAGHKKFTLESE